MYSRRRLLQFSSAAIIAACAPARWLRAAEAITLRTTPFTLGVASGYPTPTGVVLWTRLAPAPLEPRAGLEDVVIPVKWEVAKDDRMRTVVASGTEYASPEWAHSIHVELNALEPEREYWYRFEAAGHQSPIGRTRTAPKAEGAVNALTLAVASCQQYEQGYFGAYREMAREPLDLILHVGDYIYESSWGSELVRSHASAEAFTLDDYRARYALYRTDPDLQAAHAHCPWLVTWDDHEVDNDYAGVISEENDIPELLLQRRAAAYRAYYEHMPLPRRAVPFGPHMRLHAQRAFGSLANIVMLDSRQYRDVQPCHPPGERGGSLGDCDAIRDPRRTKLGWQQEEWLDARLKASKAQWNLLAQGTVTSYIDEHGGPGEKFHTDNWNGYQAARERLLTSVSDSKVSNPMFIAGDVHAFLIGNQHRTPHDRSSPVIAAELVTTSISSHAMPQAQWDALQRENPNLLLANSEHRGYLRLHLNQERAQADLVAMSTVKQKDATARVWKSYVVENGKPGAKQL